MAQKINIKFGYPSSIDGTGKAFRAGSFLWPLSSAKKKCAKLGFKSGTQEFGKCVLQLSK